MRQLKVLTMILAGGKGERLYPLTANRSKPAVPFGANFRIIDFTLMNCVLSGLRSVHLLTQYHSLSLDRHRSQRWDFLSQGLGDFIEIVPPTLRSESNFYQGTADAIYRNLELIDLIRPDVVLVLSGDHVYRADYSRLIDAHLDTGAEITVLSDWIEAKDASAFGVIQAREGRIQGFHEKPAEPEQFAAKDGRCQINLGVYCFNTAFLVGQLVNDSKHDSAHDFGKNILPDSLELGEVRCCPLEAICPDTRPYWRDVGTIDSYYETNMDLLRAGGPFELADPRWPEGSRFHDWLPSRVPGVDRDGNPASNLIANACRLESTRIANSVISPGVKVGEQSEIYGSILFPKVEIGRKVKLDRVIVEEGVRIPDNTILSPTINSQQHTVTEGGVVVVGSRYRFEEPEGGRSPRVRVSARKEKIAASPTPGRGLFRRRGKKPTAQAPIETAPQS